MAIAAAGKIGWIAAAVVASVLVARAASGATMRPRRIVPAPQPYVPPTTGGNGWVDVDAPRRIATLATPVAIDLGWPDIVPFLIVTAYTESRGDSQVGSSANTNAARGWFGIRPETALLGQRGFGVEALKNEAVTVAIAIDLVYRLGTKYRRPGQVVDWLAIRRGFAFPRLVADVEQSEQRSLDVAQRMRLGMVASGVPEDFARRPAFPTPYNYPGFDRVLELVVAASGGNLS